MTIVRVGSNEQYASNWDSIFGGGKSKSAPKASAKKTPAKKAAKKAAPTAKKKPAKKKK